MSLVELEIPVLLVPNTRSWILLIETPVTTLLTAVVHPLFLPLSMAFFSLADGDDSLFVSKTEKAEAKTLDHKDTFDNLVSLDCGSELEESDLVLQENFEATAFSQKPFITYSSNS